MSRCKLAGSDLCALCAPFSIGGEYRRSRIAGATNSVTSLARESVHSYLGDTAETQVSYLRGERETTYLERPV